MKLKYRGRPVYMNGRNYYIPSLSTLQFEQSAEFLRAGIPEGTPREKVVRWYNDIILMAIQRNYPEVTKENLDEWLDLDSSQAALEVVWAASGLELVAEGEDQPAAS
jgi:hypothetical protein